MTFLADRHRYFVQRFLSLLILLVLLLTTLFGVATSAHSQDTNIGDSSRFQSNFLSQKSTANSVLTNPMATQRLFVPYYPNKSDDGRIATIYITNVGSQTATYSPSFYTNTGTAVAIPSGQIPPNHTIALDASAQLPACRCSAVLSSNQPLRAVVRIEERDANKLALGLYQATGGGGTATQYFYAPFHSIPGGVQTELGLMAVGGASATIQLDFFNLDGSPAGTYDTQAQPNQTIWVDSSELAGRVVLVDGIGLVRITSTNSIKLAGVAIHTGLDDGFLVDESFARVSSPPILVPRVNNDSARGSHLYIANTGATSVVAQTDLLHSSGSNVSIDTAISPSAVARLDVNALPEMEGRPSIYSAVVDSDPPFHPIVGWEQSVYSPGAAIRAIDDYGSVDATDRHVLPRVIRGDDEYTLISIQNAGDTLADVVVSYLGMNGVLAGSISTKIQPGVSYHVATTDPAIALPVGFSGSAIVSSTQLIAVFVDEVGPRQHFPLTVNRIGSGNGTVASTPLGIDCGSVCTESYPQGSVITLTAAADLESNFAGWAGACTGTATCQVTIDSAKVVTATFNTTSLPAIVTNGQTVISRTVVFTASLAMSDYDGCVWDFGDNTTTPCQIARTAETPTKVNLPTEIDNVNVSAEHTYTQSGSYTVTVTAHNSAGEVSASGNVYIRETDDYSIFLPMVNR